MLPILSTNTLSSQASIDPVVLPVLRNKSDIPPLHTLSTLTFESQPFDRGIGKDLLSDCNAAACMSQLHLHQWVAQPPPTTRRDQLWPYLGTVQFSEFQVKLIMMCVYIISRVSRADPRNQYLLRVTIHTSLSLSLELNSFAFMVSDLSRMYLRHPLLARTPQADLLRHHAVEICDVAVTLEWPVVAGKTRQQSLFF